jgi:hypothetical protein
MPDIADAHVDWLVAAVSVGAKRHDSFEVERHFAVASAEAVELGGFLHAVAADGRALAALGQITHSYDGDVLIRYRSVDGSLRRLGAARASDGRLGMPTFR